MVRYILIVLFQGYFLRWMSALQIYEGALSNGLEIKWVIKYHYIYLRDSPSSLGNHTLTRDILCFDTWLEQVSSDAFFMFDWVSDYNLYLFTKPSLLPRAVVLPRHTLENTWIALSISYNWYHAFWHNRPLLFIKDQYSLLFITNIKPPLKGHEGVEMDKLAGDFFLSVEDNQ